MITVEQKEKIAKTIIKSLYAQVGEIAEVVNHRKLDNYVNTFINSLLDTSLGLISFKSWLYGLNEDISGVFLEETAHILSYGQKFEFSNGNQDFTVDVFFEDENEIVCIEFKTVKPNKGVFKVEKQKVLEAKAALKRINPDKNIIFLIGFPFDPLSDTPCGYDKQRFMNYSVDFRKYFAENEFLLSAELWDYLSGTTQTMETILSIINSIATVEFLAEFKFLQNRKNAFNQKSAYLDSLEKWYLQREKQLVENQDELFFKISSDKVLKRTFNQDIFTNAGNYNETRIQRLQQYL